MLSDTWDQVTGWGLETIQNLQMCGQGGNGDQVQRFVPRDVDNVEASASLQVDDATKVEKAKKRWPSTKKVLALKKEREELANTPKTSRADADFATVGELLVAASEQKLQNKRASRMNQVLRTVK
ncbi:hypothetical protein T484DRAFT_1745956 [Baffinella frigidus]|nr:hypothetical protein T484DRAFT_1745956 [Cryptophyta sp. CCMP2293]